MYAESLIFAIVMTLPEYDDTTKLMVSFGGFMVMVVAQATSCVLNCASWDTESYLCDFDICDTNSDYFVSHNSVGIV